jgi:hypothetical protein
VYTIPPFREKVFDEHRPIFPECTVLVFWPLRSIATSKKEKARENDEDKKNLFMN